MTVFAFVVVYNHTWQLHCTCMRNKYPCKSEMSTYNCYKSCWRWSVSQFSTCMRLKFPDWQSIAHFPWPNEFTICPDIYGVQIPVKPSCTGQRWRKTKTSLFSVEGKSSGFCSFAFRHPCPLGNLNKCSNSHHSHPLHPFITRICRECKVQNGLIL